jgi:membrane-associated protein
METIQYWVDVFLHLNKYLDQFELALGMWLYLVLFLVIFCETGLVVTPILPGDSLLFAVGAMAGRDGSTLSLPILIVLLLAAAICGDAVNYAIGYWLGPQVFRSERSRLFNKKHLLKAQAFYEKYGGISIVLARFIPILRTFAPFVAGIGQMNYRRFCVFNVAGGVAWVLTFLLGGYFMGGLEWVQDRFHIVIVAIIIISVMPAVIQYFLERRKQLLEKAVPAEVD